MMDNERGYIYIYTYEEQAGLGCSVHKPPILKRVCVMVPCTFDARVCLCDGGSIEYCTVGPYPTGNSIVSLAIHGLKFHMF